MGHLLEHPRPQDVVDDRHYTAEVGGVFVERDNAALHDVRGEVLEVRSNA